MKTLQQQLDGFIQELDAAEDTFTQTTQELQSVDDELSQMQEALHTAEAQYTAISEELDAKLGDIEDLNAQITELTSRSEIDQTKLTELQAELETATAQAEQQTAELEKRRVEYEKQLAEVNAYKLTRDPTAGEAHTATAVSNRIDVASDGVTAQWQYENTAISSKSVVLKLQLNGQDIYTSSPLLPGQSLTQLMLNTPLAAGAYSGMAVTTVYGEDGAAQFTNRVPVEIVVAG